MNERNQTKNYKGMQKSPFDKGAGTRSVTGGSLREQKGITLISLVITIVVMLILVGVTINIAVNGGLFQYAGKAVSDTQNEINKEQDLASGEIKIGDSWYNSMDDYLNGIENVRSLQEKHEFEYYSSLSKAVTDVNNNTRENADSDKENAIAGVYSDDGKIYVVLLKDAIESERIKPSVDMTINLGGNTLTSTSIVGIDSLSGNVEIDGRLEGSTIQISNNDGNPARPIQVQIQSTLEIDGGTYIGNSEGSDKKATVYSFGNIIINNATIETNETTGQARGIEIEPSGTAIVNNSNIIVTSDEKGCIGILNWGTANISDCNIKTYSDCVTDSNNRPEIYSRGIENQGTLFINECYVMGTYSAIENHSGTLYVNGGIYEGFLFGGLTFTGEGKQSYVRNATIRESEMPEGYSATVESIKAGFFIECSTGNDIKVYMDNCDIYGSRQPIVLLATDEEQNNTLYISNSKINTDQKIRIDDGGHKLYIGKGCNFTAENTTNPSAVIVTDEVYTQAN